MTVQLSEDGKRWVNSMLAEYPMKEYWAKAMLEYARPTVFEKMWANVPRTPLPWHRKLVLWLYLRRWWAIQRWWHCLWCCECGR